FRIHMKVASGCEGQPVSEACLELIAERADTGKIEIVIITGMRSGNNVGNTVGNGIFGHSQRIFDLIGAIVDSGQYVAVEIDHGKGTSIILACSKRVRKRYKQFVTSAERLIFRAAENLLYCFVPSAACCV